MSSHWFWIFGIFWASLISPGPDFAVVVKNALTRSRFSAQKTALGITAALLIHISYIMVGIGVASQSTQFMRLVELLGGIFLIYLGIKSLRSSRSSRDSQANSDMVSLDGQRGFWEGFLTNLLNPKCAFFLITLFSQLHQASSASASLYLFAGFVVLSALVWFSSLAWVLSRDNIQTRMKHYENWISAFMGLLLCFYGFSIVYKALP